MGEAGHGACRELPCGNAFGVPPSPSLPHEGGERYVAAAWCEGLELARHEPTGPDHIVLQVALAVAVGIMAQQRRFARATTRARVTSLPSPSIGPTAWMRSPA